MASLQFGNVMLMIQPPRASARTRWRSTTTPTCRPRTSTWPPTAGWTSEFGAHAVLHLGKHGTTGVAAGQGTGLADDCAPDAVLGGLPLIYPFIVNDPGEGTPGQARAHATVVDHMIPPMARADTYGDMAKLEQLLDEYATVQALDPTKLATVRGQIWELVTSAKLHHDLHQAEAARRGRLRRLRHAHRRLPVRDQGRADPGRSAHPRPGPEGEELINDVLAVLRARQVFGGKVGAITGLRAAWLSTLDWTRKRCWPIRAPGW